MSVIVAFTFAIALWYGGTFQSDTDGTFHSDMPGTFESDMDGTFKVMQSDVEKIDDQTQYYASGTLCSGSIIRIGHIDSLHKSAVTTADLRPKPVDLSVS